MKNVPKNISQCSISNPKAVLFDWDNTLVDTWGIIHASLNRTFIEMGCKPFTIEEVQDGKNGIHHSLRDSFPSFFGERWEEAREIYFSNFTKVHLEKIKAIKGAEKVLKALSKRDLYLAVVSNKTGKYLREEVEHLGWTKYFSKIIGAADAIKDKPSPEPIYTALDGSGIRASEDVWMIGDSITDIEAAVNSGCVPIFLGEKKLQKKYLSSHAREIFHFKDHFELLSIVEATSEVL